VGFFRPAQGAVLITGAQQSRQDEMRTRQRHYSYTMAFRTISFVVAVVLPIPVWAKILLLGGAIVLPWTAVTAANAGPKLQKTARAYTPDGPEGDAPPLLLDPATIIAGSVVTPPDPTDPAS
jgi:threonine/homoserine/homoserine lactone efflux protein